MHAVVVFETLWGNTEQVAREIAEGIGLEAAEMVEAVSAPAVLETDVDLLVVGGPTHAFSMSSEKTRESAKQQGATNIPLRGIREWIESLSSPGRDVLVATFDTRVTSPRLPGSAAKKAMKRLVALGFRPVAKPESFGVHGYSGPVTDGELERARRWGERLGADVASR
jgi:hypothetical protein